MNENDALTTDQKNELRLKLFEFSEKLLGIRYEFGAEWTDYSKLPDSVDCSEMVEGIFRINGLKMPDGSQAQFDFTVPVSDPQTGDLAFFGKGGKIGEIYHVGMLHGQYIIEARAHDPAAYFETGKVILRPMELWMKYKNFCGFRSHPKLV